MKQQTFTDIEYSNRRKKTKRDEFLGIMNEIILNILENWGFIPMFCISGNAKALLISMS
jgi:hypothetical protein